MPVRINVGEHGTVTSLGGFLGHAENGHDSRRSSSSLRMAWKPTFNSARSTVCANGFSRVMDPDHGPVRSRCGPWTTCDGPGEKGQFPVVPVKVIVSVMGHGEGHFPVMDRVGKATW